MASTARIREAAEALDEAVPGLSRKARQILLGQAMAESDFGDAFRTPDGSRSHNWGAVYTKGDKGVIPVGDSQDGKPFTANAAWNSSDVVGARQFHRILGNFSGALEAASRGDLHGYAKALFRNNRMPYYGGYPPGHPKAMSPSNAPLHSELDHYWRVIAYKRMVEGAAKRVASALGEPFEMSTTEPAYTGPSYGASLGGLFSVDDLWWILGGVAVSGGALYAWKKGYLSKILPKG